MAGTMPTVRDEMLTWHGAGAHHTILVGSSAWFAWLEGATSFAYQGSGGCFTARKESRQRGGWYWKAYRKLAGRLHRAYLGKTAELTAARLAAAAAALAAFAEPEPGTLRHASHREARRTVSTKRSSAAAPLPSADERPVSLVPSLRPASAAVQHVTAPPADWPRGTVTFLFTDIVDSTQLWERYPQAMPQVLVRHDVLVHAVIAMHDGVVFKTLGDAVCAAFARAPDALAAARAAQHALHAEDWTALGLPPERPLQVRMALHTGAADARNGDYIGPPLNRSARILAAGHGRQILLSHATCELVADALPDGVTLRDLGTYQLKGLHGTGRGRPEQLFQVVSPDLPTEFPPLITQAPAADRATTPLRPLLTTKLTPPPRADLTPRPRLIERLRRVTEHQLTLIVAPPGFGKTTLLSAWLSTKDEGGRMRDETTGPPLHPSSHIPHPFKVAWLTLDEADNDPVRFWAYLVAALEQQLPGIGADAVALLHAPQPAPIDTVLTVLVNAIAATSGQLVLVLDDYHVISAAPIQQALATLLAYLPPNFHLVIASRADVPLPLARLRARGQVAEIRAADLRCTPDEAAVFLRTLLGHDLMPDDIATLLERTEGWMAGLQLAALSLQGEPDAAGRIAAIRGDNRYIWDYLVDEVLDRQPAAVQQFLLHTAFLDRMCAELCDAVLLGRTENHPEGPRPQGQPRTDSDGSGSRFSVLGSQAMLEALESANLFVVPLDTERRWYRYHRLFADVLRLRLRQLHPELVTPIHRKAAAWYRHSGLTGEAIQHALAAQDWAEAAAAIEESAEALLMHGEVATLMGWARMLPPDALRMRPRLSLFYAAALTVVGQLDEAEVQVRAAEQATAAAGSAIADTPVAGATAPFPGELATIKAIVAAGRDDFSSAITYARTALAQLPAERTFWRLAATMGLSAAHWMRGELDQLIQSTEDQLALSAATGNDLLHAAARLQIAYIQVMQGKLRLAAQTCWRLLDPVADRVGALSPFAGWATTWLSDISYEWNDLDAAVRFARDGIAQSQRVGNTEQQASNAVALAHALQAQGDTAAARAAMDQAVQLAQPLVQVAERALITTSQVRLWLAQGELAAAAAWAQGGALAIDDTLNYVHVRIVEQLTLARVYLAQGSAQTAQAIPLLEALLRDTESRGQFGQATEAYALLALAHIAAGDSIRARDCLSRALTLTTPEGYIRLFADLGAPMHTMIAEYRLQIAQRAHDESSASTGTVLAYIDKLLAAFPDRKAPVESERATNDRVETYILETAMIEPLSARELEVLRLIAAGQSNQAIAQTLIIAESTVKMHLKNIYGKLDAHSRTQAIARARALGLL